MNSTDSRYTKFGLTCDMLATPEIIRGFDPSRGGETAREIA